MTVQENLKKVRLAKGVTQKSVANYIGIGEMTYSRLENDAKKVDATLLFKASEFLGVEVNIFFDSKLTDDVIKGVTQKSKEVV